MFHGERDRRKGVERERERERLQKFRKGLGAALSRAGKRTEGYFYRSSEMTLLPFSNSKIPDFLP